MMNEKLEFAAQRYVELVKQISESRKKIDRQHSDLEELKTEKDSVTSALRTHVGNNIRRKAVVLPGGIVVTLEHINDAAPLINVYENGEEIA